MKLVTTVGGTFCSRHSVHMYVSWGVGWH